LLDQVFRSGEALHGRSMEVLLQKTPDAAPTRTYVDFVFQPLLDQHGAVEGIIVQGHDVTEQQEAQLALREADRKKDEFLATLAHELRNPLAPMLNALQLLALPQAPEATRERATAVIGRQVRQMTRLLDDLIDISRITQKRMRLRPESVDVAQIMEAAVEAANPLVQARRHTLTLTPPPGPARALVDPVRITQVLTNLLNNAAKYTDPGGEVALAATVQGKMLRLAVSDNGIGISPAGIEKLFRMFEQDAGALARSDGGLGIGLALARSLVELHGGSMDVTSGGLGEGSCFIVYLPCVEHDGVAGPGAGAGLTAAPAPEPAALQTRQAPHAPHALHTPHAPPPRQPPATWAPASAMAPAAVDALPPASDEPALLPALRVLLADDNVDALEGLAEILRLEGHQVYAARDGLTAVALATRHQPDVLVLDIGMPGLNGYEVARSVRVQSWPHRPYLVAASGWGQDEHLRASADAGFDLHLTKPVEPQRLMALIAAAPLRA
jgi:signal transduction histidine kinase